MKNERAGFRLAVTAGVVIAAISLVIAPADGLVVYWNPEADPFNGDPLFATCTSTAWGEGVPPLFGPIEFGVTGGCSWDVLQGMSAELYRSTGGTILGPWELEASCEAGLPPFGQWYVGSSMPFACQVPHPTPIPSLHIWKVVPTLCATFYQPNPEQRCAEDAPYFFKA